MNPLKTKTNLLYTQTLAIKTVECSYSTGSYVDAVGPALGRQSVLHVYPPMSWL